MKIKKITTSQLKSLISEAIQGRQFGQPEPFALSEDINEAEGPSAHEPSDVYIEAVNDFSEAVGYVLASLYNPNDPSMAGAGEEGWHRQVSGAQTELEDRLHELLVEIESKLFNGEY